jgi:hypothetical protein
MRNFMNLIESVNVAEDRALPTKTKTATPSKLDKTSSLMQPVDTHRARDLTNRASQEMVLPPEVAGHMANLPQDDIISDAEARSNAGYGVATDYEDIHIPRTPETLPSIISNEVARTTGEEMHFDWVQVKHLPGYLSAGIRSLGRQVFSQLTTTKIEDIQVLATILSDAQSVKYMAAWITKFGHKIDEMTMTFHQMGGVEAHCQVWTLDGFDFLIQKDFSGYYIYAFPATDRQITDTFSGDDALPAPMKRLSPR